MTSGICRLIIITIVLQFAACKPQNERTIDDLRQDVENAQRQEQQNQQSEHSKMSEGPMLTDDWSDGVRAPSAHEQWQAGDGSATQALQEAKSSSKKPAAVTPSSALLDLCQNGDIESCHRFGYRLSQEGNHANASRFFQFGCDRELWKSCNNLGWLAERRGDFQAAADFYSRACLRHHPGSCGNLKRVTQRLRAARR